MGRTTCSQLVPLVFLSSKDDGFNEWIDASRSEPLEDKAQVVEYLRNAYCLAAVPGIERDPFNNNRIIKDGPNILSDGKWVWVATLAHWVETLDINPVDEFLSDIRERKYCFGEVPVIEYDRLPWDANPHYFHP